MYSLVTLLLSNSTKLWGEKNRSSATDAHGAVELAQQSEEAQAPVNTDRKTEFLLSVVNSIAVAFLCSRAFVKISESLCVKTI